MAGLQNEIETEDTVLLADQLPEPTILSTTSAQ